MTAASFMMSRKPMQMSRDMFVFATDAPTYEGLDLAAFDALLNACGRPPERWELHDCCLQIGAGPPWWEATVTAVLPPTQPTGMELSTAAPMDYIRPMAPDWQTRG